jgi:hypothetical protein
VAAAAGIAAATALTVGCTRGVTGPRIPDAGDGWAAAAIPDRRGGVPYPFVGAINLCIDRPGSVTITDVHMEHSEGGLRVDGFATRRKIATGTYPGPVTFSETLAELGFAPDARTVDTVCGKGDADVTEFALQFSKPTDATARGAIVHVTYQSGTVTLTHRIGFELILCAGNEKAAECQPRTFDWP